MQATEPRCSPYTHDLRYVHRVQIRRCDRKCTVVYSSVSRFRFDLSFFSFFSFASDSTGATRYCDASPAACLRFLVWLCGKPRLAPHSSQRSVPST